MQQWKSLHPWKGILASLFAALGIGIAWAAFVVFILPPIVSLIPWIGWSGWFYVAPVLAIAATIFIVKVAPRVRPWAVVIIPLVLVISAWAEITFALGFCLEFTDRLCK